MIAEHPFSINLIHNSQPSQLSMPGRARAPLPRFCKSLRWRPASQRGEQGGLEKLRKLSEGLLWEKFSIFRGSNL